MTARLVLVGAPGSGKSTVGALLAERWGEPFADDGEPAFRALEELTTAELLDEPGVLALGGGAVLSPATRDLLAGRPVVWLRVTIAHAAGRVGLNEARPLLLGNVRGRLLVLLNQRAPLYDAVSVAAVDTDGRTPAEVADAVEALGLVP